MRKITLPVIVALFAATSFAGPSMAGYYSDDCQPYCFIRKIKTYDYYGNLVIRKIRICE